MGVNTAVNLSGISLKNPVIPASGTFGFGQEFAELYDLNVLGGIAIKGTTVEPRLGNEQFRVADCPAGMLNSVGLQNPGLRRVIAEELPALRACYDGIILANISGFSLEEFSRCGEAMDGAPEVDIIEVNISCPNVHGGGMAFGQDPKQAAAVTRAVKAVTEKPVYIKLSPNVTDIAAIAVACEEAGADGLSLINTVLGMRIDLKRRRPVLAAATGGYSGPGIFPIALRCVHQVAKAVKIPLIGMGGVRSADDVLEMVMAGAFSVQVGAANLVDPWVCPRIIQELPRRMEELGISDLSEIRGVTTG